MTTFQNFKDYISGKTTMSSEVESNIAGLALPAITLCDKTAYKGLEKKNTIQDIIDSADDISLMLSNVSSTGNLSICSLFCHF